MNDYNNAQIDYRERCKARIQRQLEISKSFIFKLCINVLVVLNECYLVFCIFVCVSMFWLSCKIR
jgi:hypothetical protein